VRPTAAGHDLALQTLIADFLERHPAGSQGERALREARFDAGLAFVAFDSGCGGLGLEPALQADVDEAFGAAGYADHRDSNVIGLGMAAPTIHAHGTAEQRALLRPLFSGEHVWCQLFSEPGAGSDLAALATRAVPDGDDWIINGQKVWTSLGHVARYGLLIARTDPGVAKHRGLTYFVLDMQLPGVEVRPIRQLTGEAEFNEVYLSGVRVPDTDRLGAVGDGWAVAMTTLSSERASLGAAGGQRGDGPIAQAVELWLAARAAGRATPVLEDRLVSLWCRAEGARLLNAKGLTGARGSMAKLRMAELNQAIYDLCIDLMGLDGVTYDSYEMVRSIRTSVHGDPDARRAYLRTLANSIEGGTSEIQRTIIGERVLQLAPEPRVDKDRPWNDVPRS
jgi:alkylation response protein AidB-like acyl-CoA dehydrogenase